MEVDAIKLIQKYNNYSNSSLCDVEQINLPFLNLLQIIICSKM